MADDIAEWAQIRIWDYFKQEADDRPRSGPEAIWRGAFARYVAQHEVPPVDPLLLEARELVKAAFPPNSHTYCNCREEIDAGSWDDRTRVKVALAALKRGIELAKEADNG